MSDLAPPFALLAELTHRCPLKCPYCYNPRELVRRSAELDTETWKRVLTEAADAGVLQVHFSGGEPTARDDLEALVEHAAEEGLYVNLITSGMLLESDRLARLRDLGLMHVQLGIQDTDDARGDWVAGFDGAQKIKRKLAEAITDLGIALTVNAVIQRYNIDGIAAIIDLAARMGAGRLEVANVQYYGWGIHNRAALMPSLDQLEAMTAVVEAKTEELKGVMVIDYVVPDYYAKRPKACMAGWGRRFMNVTPEGKVLPCHAAETLPGMVFDNVLDRAIGDIWANSEAFNTYRGTAWMKEPCRSCDRREIDWGGCRCQALALTGSADNPDPVCELVPGHDAVRALASREAAIEGDFVYRQFEDRPIKTHRSEQ